MRLLSQVVLGKVRRKLKEEGWLGKKKENIQLRAYIQMLVKAPLDVLEMVTKIMPEYPSVLLAG